MFQPNIGEILSEFTSTLDPNHRYASFDYCYNYFRSTDDPKADLEKSCLTLGFYLASWGMFRGSSFLLRKSAKIFEPTIDYISQLDRSVWEIDVDNYSDRNIATIIEIFDGVKRRLIMEGNADLTLVTKVLLGVFGFIPAFDSYFCRTFRELSVGECGFRRVDVKSLGIIRKFYEANRDAVDSLSDRFHTLDFLTGNETGVKYPKAKIIDMYGFAAGKPDARARTRNTNSRIIRSDAAGLAVLDGGAGSPTLTSAAVRKMRNQTDP